MSDGDRQGDEAMRPALCRGEPNQSARNAAEARDEPGAHRHALACGDLGVQGGAWIMAYLAAGVAPVTPALGVVEFAKQTKQLELAANESTSAPDPADRRP